MTRRRMIQAGVGVLIGLAVVAGVLLLTPRPGNAEQFLLPAPLTAPDFTLTAHTGEPLHLRDLPEDGLVVLYFGYTNCPDICPVTLTDLGHARAQLGKAAERVRILFVTVDPARDTPAQLAQYVSHFPPGITGLTGSEDALERVASGYLAFAQPAGAGAEPSMPGMGPMDGTGAAGGAPGDAAHAAAPVLFDHTARSFVVKDRHVVMTFPPQTSARDMAAGLAYLLKG